MALQAGTAHAQGLDASDTRIVTMPVTSSGYLQLRTASDVTQSLLFRQGERITSVILSDPTAFFVTVAGTGIALRCAPQAPRHSGC
ncbi:hypothetical protein ACFSLT_30590 [Novosphingobium resinovorum]